MSQTSKTKTVIDKAMLTTQDRRTSAITYPDMRIHNMNVEGYDACNMLFRDPNISVEEKGRGCWSRKLFCGDKRTVQKQSVTTRPNVMLWTPKVTPWLPNVWWSVQRRDARKI